jgi:hypothetical protein
MHPELEALLRAYDAAMEASPQESSGRKEEFDRQIKEFVARTAGLDEDALRGAVRVAHRRWLASQIKPPTLPPKA